MERVLGEHYAQTQTEPSNLQFTSGFAGLTGFRDLGAEHELRADRVDELVLEFGRQQQLLGRISGGGFSGGGGGGGGGGGR